MSEPTPPPIPEHKTKRPVDPNGFNWKLLLMVCVGFGIIYWAFASKQTKPRKTVEYPIFRAALNENRLILGQQDKPLKVAISDSSADLNIMGWMMQEPQMPKNPERVTGQFAVPFNVALQGQIVSELLGSEIIPAEQIAGQPNEVREVLSLNEFRQALAKGEIQKNDLSIVSTSNQQATIIGKRERITNWEATKEPFPFQVSVNSLMLTEDVKRFLQTKASYVRNNDYFRSMFISTLLPLLLFMLVIFFLFRQQMKSAGKGAMSFGKSKARLMNTSQNKVTFKDVAGIQEAKEELVEIVDFLKDPKKFQKLGGAIPKGVLMVGSPGTGKTLLARAIAGEADVPFFSISGSDFVEMFVGVGASRVRDMFEQGKKNAPCLIFIDEIDAVGRHRGHGMGGGHDEREQTLNQMLVEMDGFDTQEGVIIIAATNRPDVLDPALLRPGRFDRQVTVSLPDVNGREEILSVHAKKIKCKPGVDLGVVARGTPGFSGAELANLLNEAALLAARKGLNEVSLEEMEEARDKVRWGRERRSLAMSEKERVGTAWHEAGHAYLNMVLPHTHPLHKVTIIPRGPYLGATMYLPDGDKYSTQKKEALASLVVTMGGRIAEAFHSDDVSNGASGDIRQATALARSMVCEWGMSDQLGMIEYGEGAGGPVFLAKSMSNNSKNYSEHTAQLIDAEIKKFIDDAFTQATQMLEENRHTVELIAMALLEYETLDSSHLKDIIEHGKMNNPPSRPKPPAIPETLKQNPASTAPAANEEQGGDMPAGVIGAHA